jgi:hypothetical protein
MSRPRAHVGSLGIGGVTPDVRTNPSVVALRYRFHVLLGAAILRPLILLWSLIRGA